MVNYSKWDAIGDSSDDEAPSRLAQDVQTKLAVAPPEAPPRNPKAEVLTDRANQVVNSLIEKHGEDKSRLLGPDERAALPRRAPSGKPLGRADGQLAVGCCNGSLCVHDRAKAIWRW